jgi:hypothetical protein
MKLFEVKKNDCNEKILILLFILKKMLPWLRDFFNSQILMKTKDLVQAVSWFCVEIHEVYTRARQT